MGKPMGLYGAHIKARNIIFHFDPLKTKIILHFTLYIQDAAERTPRFGRVIASGGKRVVEQRCTCRFQCRPWCGWENIEPLLLRSL